MRKHRRIAPGAAVLVSATGFAIAVEGTSGWTDRIVTWKTTSSGSSDPNHGPVDSGPGANEASSHGPVAKTGHTGGTSAATGAFTTVSFDGTEPERPCRSAAFVREGCHAPSDAYPAFELWASEHAVLPAWNIGFASGAGTLDDDGDTTTLKVAVPNDANPVRRKFCIVVVAMCDGQAPADCRIGSDSVEYPITAE